MISKKYFILFGGMTILSLFLFPSIENDARIGSNSSAKEITIFNNTEKPVTSINLVWEEEILNSGDDEGRDLVLDASGNIYVTGKEYNASANSFDILIAKYDSSGNQMWKRLWGNDSDDEGWAIDIDSANNHLYISGRTESFGNGSSDMVVLKYDSDGNFIWNETWGGVDYDAGYGIVVNDTNSILTCGFSEKYPLGDAVLVKFNGSGSVKAVRNWGGADSEAAYDVKVDSNYNIHLTGYTGSFGATTQDLFLVKYNKTLGFNKSAVIGGEQPDEGRKIAISEDDDIFVIGNTRSYGGGLSDVWLVKFNETLDLNWSSAWGGSSSDYAHDLVIDSKNDFYALGHIKSFGHDDQEVCLIKFNSTGNFTNYKTFGGAADDHGYGLIINGTDFLCATGKTKNSDYDLFLNKFSPLPDGFQLDHDAGTPDADGDFELVWTEALDADNYTLYESDQEIIKITNELTVLIGETTEKSFQVQGHDQGTYYFAVEAHNAYGNTTSNCVSVEILHAPGSFNINCTFDNPSGDGNANLTWQASARATSYSIYSSKAYFTSLGGATLIKNNFVNRTILIKNLDNGTHYFVVVAHNAAGQTLSECVNATIKRLPSAISLSSNAGDPDEDGNFELVWTKANYSKSYKIYLSNLTIQSINENITLLCEPVIEFDRPSYTYNVDDYKNGTYYFVVIAANAHGNRFSNEVKVVVSITTSNEKEISPIFSFDVWLFLLIIALLTEIGAGVKSSRVLKRKYDKNQDKEVIIFTGTVISWTFHFSLLGSVIEPILFVISLILSLACARQFSLLLKNKEKSVLELDKPLEKKSKKIKHDPRIEEERLRKKVELNKKIRKLQEEFQDIDGKVKEKEKLNKEIREKEKMNKIINDGEIMDKEKKEKMDKINKAERERERDLKDLVQKRTIVKEKLDKTKKKSQSQ